MLLYRMRSIDKLLGKYNELEDQTIYFARPDELNDPMEGFRDIYWKGDDIVWKNFIKHYLMCLNDIMMLYFLTKDEDLITPSDIPIFKTEKEFPSEQYKELFDQIKNKVLNNANILFLVNALTKRKSKIRINELKFYFQTIHNFSLQVVLLAYEDYGLIPKGVGKLPDAHQLFNTFFNGEFFSNIEQTESKSQEAFNALFSIAVDQSHQLKLISRYNIDRQRPNWNFIIFDFPDSYLNQIQNLLYPEWCAACFMSDCTNSSVWSHYGDKHAGVCLIFNGKTRDQKCQLKLHGIHHGYDSSGPVFGETDLEFYPIEYVKGYGQIDFFRSLGQQPIPALNSMWYKLDGKMSICMKQIINNTDRWRENYWNKFYRDILIKTKDWKYEKEYRLILNSLSGEIKNRTLTYDFNSLNGIVFGIKTSDDDKLKIIKIINKKCIASKRTDFKFYQAYYSPKHKNIAHRELSLLKFNNP